MGSTLAPPAVEMSPRERQYREALERANHVRCARAAIKRRLAEQPDKRASCTMCAEILTDPPEVLANMTVVELLMSCRRIGMVATRKILTAARASDLRQLHALSADERGRLIGALSMAGW